MIGRFHSLFFIVAQRNMNTWISAVATNPILIILIFTFSTLGISEVIPRPEMCFPTYMIFVDLDRRYRMNLHSTVFKKFQYNFVLVLKKIYA
jgi:hypothetical protein